MFVDMKLLFICLTIVFNIVICQTTTGKNNDEVNDDDLDSKIRLVPLTNSLNNFGFKFLNTIGNENGQNPIFSPLSIGQVFGIVTYGAYNNTYEELINAFDYNIGNRKDLISSYALLVKSYKNLESGKTSRKLEFDLFNLVLYSNDFRIRKSFRAVTLDSFNTEARKVDFVKDQKKIIDSVNSDVKTHTKGHIKDILTDLDVNTKLMILNALFFKAKWLYPFDAKLTSKRQFHNFDGTTSEVDFMFRRNKINYFYDNDFGYIAELQYIGNASFYIILPNREENIDDFTLKLNSTVIDYLIYKMSENTLELYLPKFKILTNIDLVKSMKKLGLNDAFSSERANFTGISSSEEIYLSQAVHKSYIEINEEGVKAAAVSKLIVTLKSAFFSPDKMIVDRPFVFFIKDNLNDLNIFMGAIKKI